MSEGGAAGAPAGEALRSIELPMSGMPGGVEVGSFIHGVLEETDFAASDLRPEIREAIGADHDGRAIHLGDRDLLVSGLAAAIETPLGPISSTERGCATYPAKDRLDELSFELPLAGGDNPNGAISMLDVASVLKQSVRAGDPLTTNMPNGSRTRC